MANEIWKVKSLELRGELLKGMEVEVIVKNRTGGPNIEEIKMAFTEKYKIKWPGGCPKSAFIISIM